MIKPIGKLRCVTKNGKVYSNYKGKGWVKLSLNRIKNNGYVIVSIRDTNGYSYTYNIHQLVALVYVPNPNNHKYVCHKDNICLLYTSKLLKIPPNALLIISICTGVMVWWSKYAKRVTIEIHTKNYITQGTIY